MALEGLLLITRMLAKHAADMRAAESIFETWAEVQGAECWATDDHTGGEQYIFPDGSVLEFSSDGRTRVTLSL